MRTITAVNEITVDAPAHAVWALLADPQRWPQWCAAYRRVHSPAPGPLPAGWRLTTAQQARLIPAATGGEVAGVPPSGTEE